MSELSKTDVLDYVADMAEQLAAMSETHDRIVAALLRAAAQAAREPDS